MDDGSVGSETMAGGIFFFAKGGGGGGIGATNPPISFLRQSPARDEDSEK